MYDFSFSDREKAMLRCSDIAKRNPLVVKRPTIDEFLLSFGLEPFLDGTDMLFEIIMFLKDEKDIKRLENLKMSDFLYLASRQGYTNRAVIDEMMKQVMKMSYVGSNKTHYLVFVSAILKWWIMNKNKDMFIEAIKEESTE